MNHYSKHVGDFIRDTVGLSMIEDGAYNRLLDQYYLTEHALPVERLELYRLARAMTPAERKAVDYVMAKFFDQTSDGWRQKRADKELAEIYARSDSARASALERWRRRNPEVDANACAIADANACADACANGDATGDANCMLPITHYPLPSTALLSNACKAKRGERLPESWVLPRQWGEWALEHRKEWTSADVRESADRFRDYWIGVAGRNGVKLNWRATWQNHVRNDLRTGKRPRAGPVSTKHEGRAAVAAAILGETDGRNDERDITGEAKRVA